MEDKIEFRHTRMDVHCFGVCLDSREEDDNQYEEDEEERRPVVTPNLRMECKDNNMDDDDDERDGVMNVVPSDSTAGIIV